ncbi:glycosyltransferase family 4 protein [Desulfovibrio sp. OttesenSCG-928-C06]|nr:glycosyltransferase family 4 protein [Desulfovibrio sp. OttesenSCG-928-C06]
MSESKIWATLHPFYEGGEVLGRKVANRSFLQALLRKDPYSAYHFFLDVPQQRDRLEDSLRAEFPEIHRRGGFLFGLRRDLPQALASCDYHCFHLSDCFVLYTALAQARNRYSRSIFPITAPTHSLSYSQYGADFLHHLWAGTSRRDVVAATSSAGEQVVLSMYDRLRQGYQLNAEQFRQPQVRIVPLGVEPEDMPAPHERERLGAAMRQKLGIAPGETVFLVFARISYLSKMDLLPILRAFKRAEFMGLAPRSYRFLLAGWQGEDETFGEEMQKFAANLGINFSLAVRPDDEERKALYACADIFLSPSDNLQETFGLTMLEAAAAGLPVIASDFDGYKDLVLHGETGFLIPTIGPENTDDTNLRSAFAPAAEYHLRLAQQCVVDVPKMAESIARLAAEPELRRTMGECGRQRAVADYSWSRVIDYYVALWDELAAAGLEPGEEERLRAAVHPAFPAYMDVFGGYFTDRLGALEQDGRMVKWSATGEAVYRGRDFPVIYQLIDDAVCLDDLKRLLFKARNPVSLSELAGDAACTAPHHDKDFLLLWALKHDLLEVIS